MGAGWWSPLKADEFGAICRAAGTEQMLQTVVIVVHLLVALGVVALVLLQQGKCGRWCVFRFGGFGNCFGSQGSATFLSRFTAILAGVFLTSLGLAFLPSSKLISCPRRGCRIQLCWKCRPASQRLKMCLCSSSASRRILQVICLKWKKGNKVLPRWWNW